MSNQPDVEAMNTDLHPVVFQTLLWGTQLFFGCDKIAAATGVDESFVREALKAYNPEDRPVQLSLSPTDLHELEADFYSIGAEYVEGDGDVIWGFVISDDRFVKELLRRYESKQLVEDQAILSMANIDDAPFDNAAFLYREGDEVKLKIASAPAEQFDLENLLYKALGISGGCSDLDD